MISGKTTINAAFLQQTRWRAASAAEGSELWTPSTEAQRNAHLLVGVRMHEVALIRIGIEELHRLLVNRLIRQSQIGY